MAKELQAAFMAASVDLDEKKQSSKLVDSSSCLSELESIVKQAPEGHTGIIEAVVQALEGFLEQVGNIGKDPAKCAPVGGGCAVFVGKWYAGKVAQNLSQIKDEGNSLMDLLKGLVKKVSQLMADLTDATKNTVPVIAQQVQELLALPSVFAKIANDLQAGTGAVEKIDLGPVDKAIDVTPIDGPLDALGEMKSRFGPTIEEVSRGVEQLAAFTSTAPKRVTAAFEVCSCMPVSKAAPPAMKDLLGKLDDVGKLDMKPFTGTLDKASVTVNDLNVDTLRDPIKSYSEEVKKRTSKLHEALETAKKAAGAAHAVHDIGDALKHGDVGELKHGMEELGGALKKIF